MDFTFAHAGAFALTIITVGSIVWGFAHYLSKRDARLIEMFTRKFDSLSQELGLEVRNISSVITDMRHHFVTKKECRKHRKSCRNSSLVNGRECEAYSRDSGVK